MNIFEQASIQKLRFITARGALAVEQLWDLPLQSKSLFDLDTLAKAVNAELKAVTEDSFVATTVSPAKDELVLKLEILKHIIAVKLAANEERRLAAARAAEREKLVNLLGEKQDEALKELTAEQIAERIKALS